jgi:phenylpropionate dioxygenase-like ring-hydroxylating dioxygenase large terminal subunit
MAASESKKKWASKYPGLGTAPVPTEPDVSPDYFEKERERIFKRCWLCVGRVQSVHKPGDYLVRDIDMLRTSIIVVRGKDGKVRGFHNVCKHRGNKLTRLCAGKTKSFVCGFHGWAYDLEGDLAYVPDEDQFFDFDKCDYGLTPVATEVWEGFIFINADSEPTETLKESMGELFGQYGDFPFDEMAVLGSYTATVGVNWKVFMDITQESYHVPFLHRRLVPDSNVGGNNPYCHFPSIRIHRRHRSSSIYSNPHHKLTPVEKIAFGGGGTVLDGTGGDERLPKGVNPDKVPNWAFDSNAIFPNLILHVGNGWFITHSYWPIAVDRTYWENKLYMNPPRNPGEKIIQEFSKVITRDLARGDLSMLETVQAGLVSGAVTHMPLSDQEIQLRHHYRIVDEFVQAYESWRT